MPNRRSLNPDPRTKLYMQFDHWRKFKAPKHLKETTFEWWIVNNNIKLKQQ